jgi:rRNA maturation RNase YbeY
MTSLPPFSLEVHAAAGKRHAAFLRRHLRAAHRILKPPLNELSLALVGDARMSALHQQFMGIAGPTDVLTFPLDVDARGRAAAGEVVVCVPEAVRRSRETGVAVERELLLYALHGLLHLCGYDDRTQPGYRRMHRREDMILTQLGVGPVFRPDAAAIAPPRGRGAGRRRSAR